MGDGVNLLRYAMPRNVFDDFKHNPANQCYCQVDTGACPPRGVIDVAQCAMGEDTDVTCSTTSSTTPPINICSSSGAPALVSFPHFQLGDPALLDKFTGLHPNAEDYQSYIDIHPTLGIALSGKSK